MKLKTKFLMLLMTILLFVPCTVNAAEVDEVDWKTAISLNVNDRILDKMFVEDEFEEKEMYVTTRLNMRVFPNVESEVKEVLKVNSKVKVVA